MKKATGMRGPPRGFITIYGMVAFLGSVILLGLAVLAGLIAGVLALGGGRHPRRRRSGRALAVGVVPLVAVGWFLMSLTDGAGATADNMAVVLFPGAIVAAIVLTVVMARRAEREQRPAGVGAPVAPSLTENAGNAVVIPPQGAERSHSRVENDGPVLNISADV